MKGGAVLGNSDVSRMLKLAVCLLQEGLKAAAEGNEPGSGQLQQGLHPEGEAVVVLLSLLQECLPALMIMTIIIYTFQHMCYVCVAQVLLCQADLL